MEIQLFAGVENIVGKGERRNSQYCHVWYEGILHIKQWSDTGPLWPSCFLYLVTNSKNNFKRLRSILRDFFFFFFKFYDP